MNNTSRQHRVSSPQVVQIPEPYPSNIIKRDGREMPFSPQKISRAIARAGKATGEFSFPIAERLTSKVLALLQHYSLEASEKITVEHVQDVVEEILLYSPYKQTAKAYLLYRDQHRLMRELSDKQSADMVSGYLARKDWMVKENSNMSFSLQGLNEYVSSEVSRTYWLNKVYPPEVRHAHLSGELHIHDLGLVSVYCVGWDLYDLLLTGFKGAVGKVEAVPARHFRTALGQVVNFLYTLQGEAAGAQAFSNFDTLLAPFIRYDSLTFPEVKQALQEFVYNLNVPTRVGFQTPFTNLTFDITIPSDLAEKAIIIGGKLQKESYGEFQNEVSLFNKAFLEVMYEGDAKGRVFTFPIPTYNITPEFQWDDPCLEGLWKVTARYGIPYFANFVNSEMDPEDARSMCCRLRLDNRELKARLGGLFGSTPLTGSIGVVTINMPRIALEASDRIEFKEILQRRMHQACRSLEIKRKILEEFTDKDLYPYIKFYLRQVKQQTGAYWTNHFSTLGLVGMNEACLSICGEDISHQHSKEFAEEILDFMREYLVMFQNESGNLYNLEATPAEGVSYRLAKLDREHFHECASGSTEAHGFPFYTNSTHLPVQHTPDIFEALSHQESLQTRYTGGTVLHGFIGEHIKDPSILPELIKVIFTTYRIPYLTITPTFSVCGECGYHAGEYALCPDCGQQCEVYSRVVGYLRPVQQWHDGKQQEFKERKTYILHDSHEAP